MTEITTTLDLRELGCQERHGLVFQCLNALEPGQSIELVNDHDPEPLRRQIKARFDRTIGWSLSNPVPQEYRVTLTLRN